MADGSAIGNRPAAPAMDRAEDDAAWSQYNPRTLFQKCVFFIQAADRDDLDEQMIRSEIESMISVSRRPPSDQTYSVLWLQS